MHSILKLLANWLPHAIRAAGKITTDEFKQGAGRAAVELLTLAFMFTVYFLGIYQLIGGLTGFIVAVSTAALLVLLIMIFVDSAFRGQSRTIRWVARLGTAMFMIATALLTSSLTYLSVFASDYSNRRAFDAVNQLTVFSTQSEAQFAAAESRFRYASELSAKRANDERTIGGTCGDGSGPGINGPRNVWRDSFAAEMRQGAIEIAGRASTMRQLAREIDDFGKNFDPSRGAAMQARWSTLTGRLRAATTDARIGQLVSDLNKRLDAADRGIGTTQGNNGRRNLVTCSDPDLRAAGDNAAAALLSIKAPPELATSIVGANIQTSFNRVFALLKAMLGDRDVETSAEEFYVFFAALFLETMFVAVKGIQHSGKPIGPSKGRGIATESLAPVLAQFDNAWNDSTAHAFHFLRPYVLERDGRFVRFAVPDSATTVLNAMDTLKSQDYVKFAGYLATAELDDGVMARLRIRSRSANSFVVLYEMSEENWGAFIAATSTRRSAVNV